MTDDLGAEFADAVEADLRLRTDLLDQLIAKWTNMPDAVKNRLLYDPDVPRDKRDVFHELDYLIREKGGRPL